MEKTNYIYLTSFGIDTRYNQYMKSYEDIINVLKNKKVAIIPNAKLITQDRTNSVIAKKELNKNNIEADIIDIDFNKLNIKEYSALYLSGGEPKYLMESINNAGLYADIKSFVDAGNIIIGQSAGAMIFCKKYFDTTTQDLLIMNDGFDYSDKMIVPHWDSLPESITNKMPVDILKVNDNDKLYRL